MASIQRHDVVHPGEGHRPLEFLEQERQQAVDARLAARRQPVQVGAPDCAGRGTECDRLDDVRTAPDAAVADDVRAVADGVADGRDLVDGGGRTVELPPAVIGDDGPPSRRTRPSGGRPRP